RESAPPTQAASATGLVMIGRGSRDSLATAEMHHFLELRLQQTPVAQSWLGFVAMASPSAEQALEAAANSGLPRIVVQPHLLFDGQIYQDLTRQVNQLRKQHPHTEWIITAPLGADLRLAETVADIASRCCIDLNQHIAQASESL